MGWIRYYRLFNAWWRTGCTTVAIGKAGAVNAGLLAAQILAAFDSDIAR